MPAIPHVPDLKPHCGFWIIIDRRTGQPVCEIFASDRKLLDQLDTDRFTIKTAAEYLGDLNRNIREADKRRS